MLDRARDRDVRRRALGLAGGLTAFVLMLLAPAPEGMTPDAWRTAALAVLMATWWITAAIPVYATGLLPLALLPLLGIGDMRAAAALRRLVVETSRSKNPKDEIRRVEDTAYTFMSAMAGNRPGFEEAARAVFAGNFAGTQAIAEAWQADIRAYLSHLLEPVKADASP